MKISVVVPAYNVERYLAEALDSLLNQTIPPHEIIVINDGSEDGTGALAEGYADSHGVRVYHTRNRGLGPARNLGLAEASGDYVYFFDADDVLEACFVEDMLEAIERHQQPDMLLFSGLSFYDDGFRHDYLPHYTRAVEGAYSSGRQAYEALKATDSLFASACLYLTRKRLWQDNEMEFKPILHEDEEVFFPLLFLSNSVVVLEEAYFHRRVRQGSIMTSAKGARNLDGYVATLKTLLEFDQRFPKLVEPSRELWKDRLRRFFVPCLQLQCSLGTSKHNALLLKVFWISMNPKLVAKSACILAAAVARRS